MTRIEASRGTCVRRNGAHSYFKEGLAAGWIALTLLVVLSGDRIVARAQQPAENSHVGKRVITQFGTVLKVGNHVVDDEGRGKELARGKNQNVFRTYTIEQVNGQWLWLVAEGSSVKGWAPAANVILIDRAIDYITRQIDAKPDDSAKYVWRANVCLELKEFDIAIADFNAVCSRIAYSDQKRPWCSYLLPAGEGAPQGRMRAELRALARKSPHPAVPATFSPREKERRPRRACNSTVKRARIGRLPSTGNPAKTIAMLLAAPSEGIIMRTMCLGLTLLSCLLLASRPNASAGDSPADTF
ncbi:MAG: hypothetical protein ACLQU5_37385 [Isosphaeraceae bacterium]